MLNHRRVGALAIVLLVACHGESGNAPTSPTTTAIKKPAPPRPGPTPAELTAGMVEAVTMGKSTVPVAVKFDLPHLPAAGQPTEITLALVPQIAADPATLVVTGSDALVLAPGSGPIEIPSVEPAQVYRHTVKLTPAADGVHLLDLKVSLKHDEIVETREFSVPIIVGQSDAAGNLPHAGLKSTAPP